MPIDLNTLQFTVRGPLRHSNGQFEFTLYVINPSPVLGAPPDIVGEAHIWVANNNICFGMAQAVKQVAAQLPPDLERVSN